MMSIYNCLFDTNSITWKPITNNASHNYTIHY